VTRKAILFTDDSKESIEARKILTEAKIDFVVYNPKEMEEEVGCCGGFTTQAPSVFAPQGIFRGIDEIKRYADMKDDDKISESAYW